MIYSLNGAWKLTGVWPYAPILGKSLETGGELMGITGEMDAQVPGSIYKTLMEYGYIEDPRVGMNSLKSEWVESKWWIYEREFFTPPEGERYFLRFEGLDYRARIYVNEQCVCLHEGTCIPAEIEVTRILASDGSANRLRVLLEECPREVALGYTSQVRTQKPRFGYKWDFGTRLVEMGIWDDVRLISRGRVRIEDPAVTTDFREGYGEIAIRARTDEDAYLTVDATDPSGKTYSLQDAVGTEHQLCLKISCPDLWFPNGYGAQPLYQVRIRAYDASILSDEVRYDVGIRSLRFEQNEGAPRDAYPYTVFINDRRIYLRGVNLVPLDHMYGSIGRERYEQCVRMMSEANVNLVRVWGGGLIERNLFYDLCDRMGILIWQEFTQSGAGVESVPGEDESFLRLLERAATAAIKGRRNHTALTFWCGGNELRARPGEDTPVTLENRNVALLKKLVDKLDAGRIFYPSSACGPYEFIAEGPGGHDVHGRWRYEGTSTHYALYNEADNLLHSEFGVDGMSSVDGVRHATGETEPSVTDMRQSLLWRFHGEWWDNREKNERLFGKFVNLEEFSSASQLMQAEGIRYIIEANRRRAFHNSGSIVWQFNEPWHNVSCTNLVEYSFRPKLAYEAVKNAYTPVNASLSYDTLCPTAGKMHRMQLYLSVFGRTGTYTVIWEMEDGKGSRLSRGEHSMAAERDGIYFVADLTQPAPFTEDGMFFIRIKVYNGADQIHDNAYFFSTNKTFPFRPMIDILKRRKKK